MATLHRAGRVGPGTNAGFLALALVAEAESRLWR